MAINSVQAIKFSNERIRVSADKLAQSYYLCDATRDRWNALGSGQLPLMENDIHQTADLNKENYKWFFETEKLWFVLGGTGLIPSDSSQILDNGDRTAQDSTRSPITGQYANNIMNRVIQFQNWLLSASGDFTDSNRNAVSYYNTIIKVSSDIASAISSSDGGNFINRCNELTNRYESNSNLELGQILQVAVNPSPR